MAITFDPYSVWLGIPPAEQPPDHYRLLGLARYESNPEEISKAANKHTSYIKQFENGKRAGECRKLHNEISTARFCLLSETTKADYDGFLRSRESADVTAPPAAESAEPTAPPSAVTPTASSESDAAAGDEGSAPTAKNAFLQYELEEKLGTGGKGNVYKARHRETGEPAAMKMISGSTANYELTARFRRKIAILSRLKHPNIVAAYEAGEHEGVYYLLMEYVDGENLATLIKQQGPLPVATAVDYVRQTAAGLSHAHAQGVLHRNIKPTKLLVNQKGTVKLIGFRLAKLQDDTQADQVRLTMSGQVMGTFEYMAPEQAEDTSSADHRADIYSLGCTLFGLVTGRHPYPGNTPLQKAMAHRQSPIPSLNEARADVPAVVDAVFQKMLAKKPEDRYQSMDEVVTALEGCGFT